MSLNSTSLQLDIVSKGNRYQGMLISIRSELGPNCVPHCLPCEHTLHNKFYQVYFALVLYFVPPLPFPLFQQSWTTGLGAHLPLPLHVAGWVGLSPHLSFHLHPGGDAPHSLAHPYFAGCAAATLVTLLIIARVCCCHPCCLTCYC